MAADITYLDYNATGIVRPSVVSAMALAQAAGGNPNSVHGVGRAARARIEDAREAVAALVGAEPANVIFTGGGTEADNLALKGQGACHLIVSAIEHGAVLAPALLHDPDATILPVDDRGIVDLEALDDALANSERPCIVSVMLANNETGVIQPIAEIAARAHAAGALTHTDAIQGAGKMPIDIDELGVDMLSLSAHKIGGPQGVGALVLARDLPLMAQNVGGGQERGRRSGTENTAGIVGFGEAARIARGGIAAFRDLAGLRDELEERCRGIAQQVRVFGAGAPRLANTSCLSMPGVRADTQVIGLDLEGIAVSAGAACSSGKVAPSHVLEAMGVPEDEATCAIRVSLGWNSTPDDIERFVSAWKAIYRRCRSDLDAA